MPKHHGLGLQAADTDAVQAFYDAARREAVAPALRDWMAAYGRRLEDDALDAASRREHMRLANPRYVLRNYLAQQAIDAAEVGDLSGVHDLLDVMRLAHALRPQGIEWPQREDGKGTSFRLEHLAEDYPGLAAWFDRPLNFGQLGDLTPDAEGVPRLQGSRSQHAIRAVGSKELKTITVACLYDALKTCGPSKSTRQLNTCSPDISGWGDANIGQEFGATEPFDLDNDFLRGLL